MIGITQDNRGPTGNQIGAAECLDGGLRANRHKYRCINDSMRRLQATKARLTVRIGVEHFKDK
jgi:hypothetical protein